MKIYTEISQLLKREWLLERRHKHAIGGLVLYIASTIFVCFLSFEKLPDSSNWNALLWVILLFVNTSAASRSFDHDGGNKTLYLYTLASPQAIILSKIIYNTGLMAVLSLLAYGLYALVLGNVVQSYGLFFTVLFLGSSGLASLLTLNSAIVAKTGQSAIMMVILSFPLILPLLITIIRLSNGAINGLGWSENLNYLVILLALNVMIGALSFLLFPYLWRD